MTKRLVCSVGVQLKVHEPTVKLMQAHYAKTGKEVNEARLRMATLPEGAEVCSITSGTLTACDAWGISRMSFPSSCTCRSCATQVAALCHCAASACLRLTSLLGNVYHSWSELQM